MDPVQKAKFCKTDITHQKTCSLIGKFLFIAGLITLLIHAYWFQRTKLALPIAREACLQSNGLCQGRSGQNNSEYEFVHQGVRFKKQFAYYVQTEECIPEYLISPDALGNHTILDVYVLSFRRSCTKPKPDHLTYLFNDKTTWSTGRNHLFLYVRYIGHKYFYHIFIDDDVELFFTDNYVNFLSDNKLKEGSSRGVKAFLENKNYAKAINEKRDGLSVWRHYEQVLMEHSPAYAVINLVQLTGEELRLYQKQYFEKLCPPGTKLPFVAPSFFIDTRMIGYHYKALPLLLPYNAMNEKVAWAISAMYTIYRANAILYKQTVTVWGITSINKAHRDYPRGRPPENYMEQYFNTEGKSIKDTVDKRDYDFVMFWSGGRWKDVFFNNRAVCTSPVKFPVTDHYSILSQGS